ncbi:MAG: PstS family phosphate ABC transporter substrate-binding protein [Planctomycetes bacterium]|nr:PstS family phosphate ABC transporter substrate-binding protein [Planctomycetota bacterium]
MRRNLSVKRTRGILLGTALAAGLIGAPAFAQVKVDPKLPVYRPVSGVSGSIKSVGSDTMNNLMTLWAEGFLKMYPNVKVEIEGKGSSTAPPALIAGTSTFGPMSRKMKDAEIDAFEKKFGYKPTPFATSIDMLAVFVNKDNPIPALTLQQIDAMFSSTRKGGYPNDIRLWGDLGLAGDWATKPISLYGRNAASGTYAFFKEHALFKGDYKDTVKEQPGTSAVVQAAATDRAAIGYGGIGYKTADVLAVPLAADAKATPCPATVEHAYSGEYPLSRFLYLYVNYKPGSQLDPLRREFLKFVFSRQGQEVVVRDGYFPISATIATKALKSIGVSTGG